MCDTKGKCNQRQKQTKKAVMSLRRDEDREDERQGQPKATIQGRDSKDEERRARF